MLVTLGREQLSTVKLLVNACCKTLALPDESETNEPSLLQSGPTADRLRNLLLAYLKKEPMLALATS